MKLAQDGRIQERAQSIIKVLLFALATSPLVTANAEPVVRVGTNLGDLFITLTPEAAPNTVANFRTYIENGNYINSFFHFSQPSAPGVEGVIQTGKFVWPEGTAVGDAFERDPVVDEFNQSNTRGTVAMVREDDVPNSATNSWFINTVDNGGSAPNGFDFLNGGVTVFGRLNDRSLALADEIAALDIEDRGDGFENLPVIGDSGAFLQRAQTVLILDTEEFESISEPVAAVLPGSRTVPINVTATAFATILNTDTNSGAVSCRISPPAGLSGDFSYRLTNPTTNEPEGTLNPLVDVPAAGAATFIISVTPTANFESTDLVLDFNCGNAQSSAVSITGVNTFTLSAPAGASSDVVAIARTVGNTGINDIPQNIGSGAFAVATSNVGDAETITASVDDGGAELPIEFFVCATNAVTGLCLSSPAAEVQQVMGVNSTDTFAVFAQLTDSNAQIEFSPAEHRAFVRFRNAAGQLRGSTSVALRTQAQ